METSLFLVIEANNIMFPKKSERVKVYMNLSIPDAIEKYKDLPFDGIGLMRIEFIIASCIRIHPLSLVENGKEEIYIDELSTGISKVSGLVYPRPVIVRFSDLKTNEYKNLKGGGEFEPTENNPMMGWRGASRYISSKYEQIFRLECAAIKRVRNAWKNVWVMIPFVRTYGEAKQCLRIIEQEGLERTNTFEVWLMAEVPSFSFMMDEFNKLPIDGYSIGSNDLCQLILGVDRDNSTLLRMGYFDERDPAVMKAMEVIVEGSRRGGKKCSICGESASNYREVVTRLVKLGIDSVSVNPDSIIRTRTLIKKLQK